MCHFDSDKNTKDVSGIGGTKPMKKLVLGACLAIMLGFIGGCAWAPGGHIDYRTTADTDLDDQVDIVPITPSLISTYRVQNSEPKARPMPPELIREIEDYQYRVGSGDVLNIIVYDHPELTIPAGSERSAAESGTLVHAGGTIYYPFVGTIQVAGRTVGEIRQILTNRLSTYITDPQVEVSVAAFRSKKFYVSGSVNSPGVQPITNVPMTVLDAISQAGGPTDDANWHHVALTRDGRETALSIFEMLHNGDLSRNTLMQSGDILHVSSSDNQRISVLGQVLSPGHISTGRERLSLTDALSRAGGVVEARAEPSGIFVIRGNPPGSDKMATVYQLDISNAAALNMGAYFPLEPLDVVYVTSAPLARWNTVISLLLPSVSLPGQVAGSASDVRDL